jgi:hypothetical protein
MADPLRILLPTLHPGQESVLAASRRFNCLCCGRRFGKTAFGVERACDAILKGQRVGWFAPTYKYLTEVWDEVKRRLGPLIKSKDEQEMRIEFTTGGIFECWSLDKDDAGRSRKYHVAIIDEAGLVGDLWTIFLTAIRATLVDYKGSAWVLGTPKGAKHGFSSMLAMALGGADPEWAGFRRGTVDNPYIDPDEIEAARRSMPAGLFAQEFEGVPMDDGTHPIGYEAIAAVQGDASERRIVCWGLDLARASDFTVLVGLDAYGRWVRIERWQAPWGQTKARIRATVGFETPVLADATGVGDAIVEDLQRMGLNIGRFIFTTKSKRELVERLIGAIHGKHVTIPKGDDPKHGWLKAELDALEVNQSATGPKYEAPRGLHDDGVFALALAIRAHDAVPLPEWNPEELASDNRDVNAMRFDSEERALATQAEFPVEPDEDFGSLGTGW